MAITEGGTGASDAATARTNLGAAALAASNTHTAGTKNTFQHDATTAGLNLGTTGSDPSSLANGDIWYNSSSGLKFRTASTTRTLVTRDTSETLTNKTLTSPQINTPKLDTSSTVGYVWTATGTDGAGGWAVAPGGGSGISRTIVSVTSTITGGAAPSTDYVYLLSSGAVFTMPTAVSNTNRYTIKNVDTANKTVSTTSSQTIDGSISITLTPNTSVDLISNGSNWVIV